ncbi:hypothetical protein [Streptomyces sp. NBC_00576]|uniref:hypothetical protein n=1 Tax=Streptomyces sp. NBC_00576 TaxID=2903665 RepID=UPI002E808E48|nr:hypothetical protein [Streptomyces sp. NBC_00576]WUB68815.1 hypothetical protein OG734_01175 [Streptomyces sp. NBC_00576]
MAREPTPTGTAYISSPPTPHAQGPGESSVRGRSSTVLGPLAEVPNGYRAMDDLSALKVCVF